MISPASRPSAMSFGTPPRELVEEALAAQQSLTAVERFSTRHDEGSLPDNKSFYRDLIPLRAPEAGEQYAFEVDLDRCTGCKACVTACHNLNGLDEDETWRHVGVLQRASAGGSLRETPGVRGFSAGLIETLKPVQQHVTTACHHCADPGCAQGCPTLAYEKDPETGVVRHLDDQCFGCQYCILKCPYDVPQYSAKRGIVRKCDLCIGRLRAGEAPACAQACPTQAIRVTLVATAAVVAAPSAAFDLPGAPDPSRVMPTTRYRTTRGLPEDMTALDAAQARPEHAHLPLVAMLTASQAAAGYWILLALSALSSTVFLPTPDTRLPTVFPLAEILGVIGVQFALGLSLLHLGRPLLAWKAFLGWRRSWLSREVIAFSSLAGTTGLYAAFAFGEWGVKKFLGVDIRTSGYADIATIARAGLAFGVIASCFAALYASAMVYRDTPRALWATRATLWRFGLTAVVTGIPAWLFVGTLSGHVVPSGASTILLTAMVIGQLSKLRLESSLLSHRNDDDPNALWKGARLLFGALQPAWFARIFLALLGGIILPIAVAAEELNVSAPVGIGAILMLTLAGELAERYLFFVTTIAPRMPGGRK